METGIPTFAIHCAWRSWSQLCTWAPFPTEKARRLFKAYYGVPSPVIGGIIFLQQSLLLYRKFASWDLTWFPWRSLWASLYQQPGFTARFITEKGWQTLIIFMVCCGSLITIQNTERHFFLLLFWGLNPLGLSGFPAPSPACSTSPPPLVPLGTHLGGCPLNCRLYCSPLPGLAVASQHHQQPPNFKTSLLPHRRAPTPRYEPEDTV